MTTHVIKTEEERARCMSKIKWLDLPATVTIKDGALRTLDQNALVHKWFGEIAGQRGDVTAADVKAEYHIEYGFPILMRDRGWAGFHKTALAHLNHAQTVYALKKGWVPVTRQMTVKELTEYMDAVSTDARGKGFHLTHPEDAA